MNGFVVSAVANNEGAFPIVTAVQLVEIMCDDVHIIRLPSGEIQELGGRGFHETTADALRAAKTQFVETAQNCLLAAKTNRHGTANNENRGDQMIRDTYRAVLVVVVAYILAGDLPSFMHETKPGAMQLAYTQAVETRPPSVETRMPVPVQSVAQQPRSWQTVQPTQANWNSQWGSINVKPNVEVSAPQIQKHEKPLRRVAQAFVEVGDALIGIVK